MIESDFQKGKNYLLVLPFGWVLVGTFQKMSGICHGVFEDAAYVSNANCDWGTFCMTGPKADTAFNPVGTKRINIIQTLWDGEFNHVLPYADKKKKKKDEVGVEE